MKILLGPAGSPAKSRLDGLKAVHDLGLQAMEVAFTHGIKMGNELAMRISEENKKYSIALSIHAPYYLNLNSTKRQIVTDSRKRILQSCERGHAMGAGKIIFHPAYYGSRSKSETYDAVKAEITELLDAIKTNKWKAQILAETMGRVAQFGDLDELVQLSKDTKCGICVDPAHIYARNHGSIDYDDMFDALHELRMKEVHFHFSCINFGPGGERNHLVLGHKPDFHEFAAELLQRKYESATIVCESPITWKDSLNMKNILEKLLQND